MSFRDLAIGERFKFLPSSDGFHRDRNCYIKLSARKYAKEGFGTLVHLVGTINVTVERA